MDSYYNLLIAWLVLCIVAGSFLLFKTAPYGRYLREGWGFLVPSRLGWILFESPPVFLMITFFLLYSDLSLILIVFLSISVSHHTEGWLKKFSETINKHDQIIEVYRITGSNIDYLLKIVAPTITEYDRFQQQLIGEIEFTNMSSGISLKEIKKNISLPLNYL